MDGKARYLDNIFIQRLWRSIKHECVCLHAWETGSEAKAGVGRWINFYNHQRPHAIRRENSPPDCFLILLIHGGQPPAVVCFNATETGQQVQAVASITRKSAQELGSSSLTRSNGPEWDEHIQWNFASG